MSVTGNPYGHRQSLPRAKRPVPPVPVVRTDLPRPVALERAASARMVLRLHMRRASHPHEFD